MSQELKIGNKGLIVGKSLIIAGISLFGYIIYSVTSAQLGYNSCPEFGRSVSFEIIGWCGEPSQYWPYVFGALISNVLGFFVSLSALTRFRSPYASTRTRISVEILLTGLAILFLLFSMLVIMNNFHIDYYG
jgi:hypothetical protein